MTMPLFGWYLVGGLALILVVGCYTRAHERDLPREYPLDR